MSQIAWVNTPYGWVTSVPGRGWILESDYYNLLRYPVTYQWDLAQNQQHPFHHHHRRHQSLNDPLLFPLRSFFNQHGQKLDFKIQSKWPHVLITLCFGLSQLSFALWKMKKRNACQRRPIITRNKSKHVVLIRKKKALCGCLTYVTILVRECLVYIAIQVTPILLLLAVIFIS